MSASPGSSVQKNHTLLPQTLSNFAGNVVGITGRKTLALDEQTLDLVVEKLSLKGSYEELAQTSLDMQDLCLQHMHSWSKHLLHEKARMR